MANSAGQLSQALGSGRVAGVQPLLRAFDQAAVSNHTITAQRAQIAAVRAYDSAIGRVSTLSGQIDSERARLANKLK
jgi:hypothetical protein